MSKKIVANGKVALYDKYFYEGKNEQEEFIESKGFELRRRIDRGYTIDCNWCLFYKLQDHYDGDIDCTTIIANFTGLEANGIRCNEHRIWGIKEVYVED